MNIKNIIETIEPFDIARTEQQLLSMETEHQGNQFNMLAFAE